MCILSAISIVQHWLTEQFWFADTESRSQHRQYAQQGGKAYLSLISPMHDHRATCTAHLAPSGLAITQQIHDTHITSSTALRTIRSLTITHKTFSLSKTNKQKLSCLIPPYIDSYTSRLSYPVNDFPAHEWTRLVYSPFNNQRTTFPSTVPPDFSYSLTHITYAVPTKYWKMATPSSNQLQDNGIFSPAHHTTQIVHRRLGRVPYRIFRVGDGSSPEDQEADISFSYLYTTPLWFLYPSAQRTAYAWLSDCEQQSQQQRHLLPW